DIKNLVVPSGEQEVWHLLQLLSSGRTHDALRYARGLLEHGEDPFSLWNMLLWMLRNLVAVTSAVREGNRNPAKIASLHHVPFPTAKTLLSFSEKLSLDRLRSLVNAAVDADIGLKTGALRATSESPEELVALIDRFVLGACQLAKAPTPLRSS
ncbi:MAG: hypothetical protein RIQ56_167, partial [Candidatus Parcubacteria bacterium]